MNSKLELTILFDLIQYETKCLLCFYITAVNRLPFIVFQLVTVVITIVQVEYLRELI